MGRKPIGDRAMTPAERKRRHKAKVRAERLAAVAALPRDGTWFGLELMRSDKLLAALQPADPYPDRMKLELKPGTLRRVDRVLDPGETREDFVRAAARDELARRKAKQERGQ